VGIWGRALFSDDTARDVRDEFRRLAGDGLETGEATTRLLETWKDSADDPDEQGPFWFALAATQWELGRLDVRVRKRALALIASGEDLERWADDPAGKRRRRALLEELRKKLLGPPPRPKRLRKVFRDRCDWAVGQLVGYRLGSGRWILLHVVDHHEDAGRRAPVMELLDWVGDDLPAKPPRAAIRVSSMGFRQFLLARTSQRELPVERVRVTPWQRRAGRPPPPGQGLPICAWRRLDRMLAEEYDLS
jgi:hypothetical protein